MKKCNKCGKENDDNAKFCVDCGESIENIIQSRTQVQDNQNQVYETPKQKKAKKKWSKKKKIIVWGAVCLVLLIGAVSASGGDDTKTASTPSETTSTVSESETSNTDTDATTDTIADTATETGNILLDTELHTADSLSGSGEVIGTRAYINISRDDLASVSEKQFIDFVNNIVDSSGYDYITIICDDGTGILFPGSSIEYAIYGNVDNIGMLVETLNTIIIDGDTATFFDSGNTITFE